MQTKTIAQIAILTALTFSIQMAGFPVFITGPFVNAMLFFITHLLGVWAGVILGCLTPLVALIRGHLPPALYPALPFVILGNLSLVIVFYQIQKQRNFASDKKTILIVAGIVSASVVKFAFLTFSVKWILPVLLGVPLPSPFVVIMTLPQLFTALAGGLIFWGLTKVGKFRRV